MTRNEKNNQGQQAAPEKSAWVGIIPDIFGYGMSVMADSKEACDQALRAEYRKWKQQRIKFWRSQKQAYDPSETNYDKSFADMGGRIFPIAKGVVYFDNFGS